MAINCNYSIADKEGPMSKRARLLESEHRRRLIRQRKKDNMGRIYASGGSVGMAT